MKEEKQKAKIDLDFSAVKGDNQQVRIFTNPFNTKANQRVQNMKKLGQNQGA